MAETEIKSINGKPIADTTARKNKADKTGWEADKYIGTDASGNLITKDPPQSGITQENDPTVPAWAKQPEKPSYTADEVGALPASTKIPAKTSDITNDSGFITKAVTDLVNYYTKSQTYTQAEVNALVSAIPKFAISVVSALPTSGISTTTVYLVKSGTGGDLYTEYIYVNGAWEILGSQRVDLTGYATEAWVNTKIADFLTADKLTAAIITAALGYAPAKQTDVDDLSTAIADQGTAVSNLTKRVEVLESGEDGEPENLIVSYTDEKYMSSGYIIASSESLTLVEAHGLVPGRKLRCTLWADPNNTVNTAFGFSADDVGVKDYTEFTWAALGNDIYECTIPTGVEILKFNIYTTQKETAVCYMPNAETEGDNADEINYIPSYITNIVAKPLGFESGKKLVAFGDSITFGVQSYFDANGDKQLTNDYTNHYIKVFCDIIGLELTNKALSGTTLANVAHPTEATLTSDKSIYAQVTSTDLSSYDYILIAGGCNDGALQTTLGTLGSTDDTTVYGALEKMCQYIRDNKKTAAKVILITPIPLLKTLSTPLETYRNAVFEVAVRYGYNVVDGYKLGFPYEESNYSKMVFPDGCHPSIIGHRMYANSLLGVLVCEQIETAEIPTPEPPATTVTNYAEPNDTNTTDWSIWINDSRIGSDGTRRDASGYSVSNYIRMNKGDYVEFEGFNVEEQFPTFGLYDSGKNKVGTVAWAQYYKDNDIATFENFSETRQRVVFSNVEESVYYVRVCGKPSNTVNDVIITINEEIS